MNLNIETIKIMISQSSNIIITAHKNLDLDALGASLGFYFLTIAFGKEAHLLIEDKIHEAGVEKVINVLKDDYLDVSVKNLKELETSINENTLLIILDTHITSMIQNPGIVDLVKNKMVFDHHVIEDNKIRADYQYINEKEASVSEIVVKIIKKLRVPMPDLVATTMLAGIIVDTNSFLYKTSARTHDTASYLIKNHASIEGVQYLLKEDFKKYAIRQEIIKTSELIDKKYAVALSNNDLHIRQEDLAKISNELLLFSGIEASYTIGKINNQICVSARSLGKVDVEDVMKQLGGGGHKSDAAAQINDSTLEEVKQKIINIISTN